MKVVRVATRNREQRISLKDDTSPLAVAELDVRNKASHNIFFLVLVNTYSAFVIFATQLVTLESMISVALSVTLTIYAYNETKEGERGGTFDGSTMNWVLLSFAIITPISAAASMAFRRREQALVQTATLRCSFLELYTAHAIWDWGWKPDKSTGKTRSEIDWLEHADATCREISLICKDLTRLLTLPCSSRARHKITALGVAEAEEIDDIGSQIKMSIIARYGKLADLCEVLKHEGLPPNEATRIRQWERMTLAAIEQLQLIKMYRTPQGLRSFARLFSALLPPFYTPYYAQLAHDVNSLGVAVAFSVVTSIALTSLFEVVNQMEDPFLASSYLDGVSTKHEVVDSLGPELISLRAQFFPEAPPLVL